MFKKPHFLAGLAAAVVVWSTVANSAWAAPPERVPRFMMTFGYVWDPPAPLDWDAEGSVAMVVMPQDVEQPHVRYVNPACDCGILPPYMTHYTSHDMVYDAIMNTLERNLADRVDAGEITQEEIAAVGEMLFGLFDGEALRPVALQREVTHVAKGGAQRLTNVYFDALPPNGALAQAGPDGDVLVLGEFCFHRITETEASTSMGHMFNDALVVVDPDVWGPGSVTHTAQIAIGWFTK